MPGPLLWYGAAALGGLLVWSLFSSKSEPKTMLSVESAQQILTELGYKPGPVDGKYGPATKSALRSYQSNAGLETHGQIDSATSESLVNERVPAAKSAAYVEPEDDKYDSGAYVDADDGGDGGQDLESGFIDPEKYDPVGQYTAGYEDGAQQLSDEEWFKVPPFPPIGGQSDNFKRGWWDAYDGKGFNPPGSEEE